MIKDVEHVVGADSYFPESSRSRTRAYDVVVETERVVRSYAPHELDVRLTRT